MLLLLGKSRVYFSRDQDAKLILFLARVKETVLQNEIWLLFISFILTNSLTLESKLSTRYFSYYHGEISF